MQEYSHSTLTRFCVELLRSKDPTLPLVSSVDAIARGAEEIDHRADLELVDVEGLGRDDPHEARDQLDLDDAAHCDALGVPFTTFSHFIDIRKGAGLFDDYDGYSYARGSGCREDHESAADAILSRFAGVLSKVSAGMKVDEGIAWYFNDEYVHAPGQRWYRACSPAIEQYSRWSERGRTSVEQESTARFPVAESTGKPGLGYPSSVFLPVDNLARYWLRSFQEGRAPEHLGHACHAIQDASIPHHAAGTIGNFHAAYEHELDGRMLSWLAEPSFRDEVERRFAAWYVDDPSPAPSALHPGDEARSPRRSWPIDALVTWMALAACDQFARLYGGFAGGYRFDEAGARELTIRAATLTLLTVAQAAGYVVPAKPPVLQGPAIDADPPVLDFGFVVGTRAGGFAVRNVGDAPLRIASVTMAPAPGLRLGATVPATPAVLAPGAKLAIPVSYDSRGGAPGPGPAPLLPALSSGVASAVQGRRTYVTVRSDARNAPVLTLEVRAGGFPTRAGLELELGRWRTAAEKLPAPQRRAAVALSRELVALQRYAR